jgi:hypothetical protein
MPNYTLAEILDRAEQLAAGVGGDPQNSPVVDNGLTAEALLPHVWQIVTTRTAKDPKRQHLLRQKETLTFSNGVAPLPDDALTEALSTLSFNDPEIGQLMSWMPYMFDFQRPARVMVGAYTVNESGNLLIRKPGENYDPSNGFSGDLDVTLILVPGLTDPVTVPQEIIDDVVAGVAGALRGEEPWKKMIMEVIK